MRIDPAPILSNPYSEQHQFSVSFQIVPECERDREVCCRETVYDSEHGMTSSVPLSYLPSSRILYGDIETIHSKMDRNVRIKSRHARYGSIRALAKHRNNSVYTVELFYCDLETNGRLEPIYSPTVHHNVLFDSDYDGFPTTIPEETDQRAFFSRNCRIESVDSWKEELDKWSVK